MEKQPKIHPAALSTSGRGRSGSVSNLSSQFSSISFDSKLKRLADSIHVEDEENERLSVERFRLLLKEIFTNSIIGDFYNNTLLIVSVFSCFQYIQQTYADNPDDTDYVELAIAILFTWDWCLNCFIADHKMIFFTR
jgi:hypothetical protein